MMAHHECERYGRCYPVERGSPSSANKTRRAPNCAHPELSRRDSMVGLAQALRLLLRLAAGAKPQGLGPELH